MALYIRKLLQLIALFDTNDETRTIQRTVADRVHKYIAKRYRYSSIAHLDSALADFRFERSVLAIKTRNTAREI